MTAARGITIGSLFSGIGGLDLGIERGLGPAARVAWQIEADPWCLRVLAKHWKETTRYGDITKVRTDDLERVDIVAGGFPCQDISLAGKGAGLEGAQSGLWWEMHRVIRDLRPRYVVVENVAAIRRRGLAAVLGALAALGYDAVWDSLPAFAVGAPHQRDRLFLVAWRVPNTDGGALRYESERGSSRRPQASDPWYGKPVDLGAALAVTDRGGRGAQREPRGVRDDEGEAGDHAYRRHVPTWPPAPDDLHAWRRVQEAAESDLRGVAHGVPLGLDGNGLSPAVCRVEHPQAKGPRRGPAARAFGYDRRRLKGLGNAVVPAVAEIVGIAIARAEGL